MQFNKGVVAAGMLVGVMLVAGVIRIRFFFDPPEDRFTNRVAEILNSNTVTTNTAVSNTNALNSATVLPTAISAQPELVTTPITSTNSTQELGSGIILQLQSQADGALGLVLTGQQLVVREYDAAWKQVSEHVLNNEVALVNGAVPFAALYNVQDGYILVLQQSTNITVTTISDQFEVGVVTTLTNDVATTALVKAIISNDRLWLLSNQELRQYNVKNGLLETSQSLPDTACDLISDSNGVVAVTKTEASLYFNKLDRFGTINQRASLPMPSGVTGCVNTNRLGRYLVVQAGNQIFPYSDNLQQAYPVIISEANQLYPIVTQTTEAFWVSSSMSKTLGSYSAQVTTYSLLTL